MAKILIIEDHPIVREGLARIISNNKRLNYTVVGKVDNCKDALSVIRNSSPEIITVDIFLEGGDGIELIKYLRQQNKNLRILVFSMHDENLYAYRAINAGADGYIMKSETGKEILNAIETVAGGDIYLSSNMITRMLRNKKTGESGSHTLMVNCLSDRELSVFQLFGHGWKTSQIASELNLSIKTVETYCSRIKKKLGIRNINELIQYAVKWVNRNELSITT